MREGVGKAAVVRHEQERALVLREGFPQGVEGVHVEVVGRLVEQEKVHGGDEQTREGELDALPAAEHRHRAENVLPPEQQPREQGAHRRLALHRLAHGVFEHRPVRVEVLERLAEISGAQLRRGEDAAPSRADGGREIVHERRLAAAVRAEQQRVRPSFELEGRVLEEELASGGEREVLRAQDHLVFRRVRQRKIKVNGLRLARGFLFLETRKPRLDGLASLGELSLRVRLAALVQARLRVSHARGRAPHGGLFFPQRLHGALEAGLLLFVRLRLKAAAGKLLLLLALEGREAALKAQELPFAQLPDLRAEAVEDGAVVAHKDERVLPLHLAAEQLHALKIEVRGRLVGKEQRRFPPEGRRQLAAGLLPAAHARRGRGDAAQAEAAERFRVGGAALRAELDEKGDGAADAHRALVGAKASREDRKERRLAAPVRADEADAVALIDSERLRLKQKPFPRVLRERRGFEVNGHKKSLRFSGRALCGGQRRTDRPLSSKQGKTARDRAHPERQHKTERKERPPEAKIRCCAFSFRCCA